MFAVIDWCFIDFFLPKTLFYDWKLYGAQFLSSRQFPESSIKTILLVSIGQKAIALQWVAREEKCWKKNFILVFVLFFSTEECEKGFRQEKVITRLYFSHYELESMENRIIAISPVKTKNRVKSIESRDVRKQKEIYRLLLYRGFRGWIWKVFAFNFTCVMCSAVLRFPSERSQGKLNLFFSFSFLRFCVGDILQFGRM